MQFLLYLVVGGLAFFVDIGVFIGLCTGGVPVIPASITSFLVATLANYLLSITLAFEAGRFRRSIEIIRFLAVVLIGLAFNTALVWYFAYPLAMPPVAAKIAAVPIVLAWNYLGRRLLVFSERVPLPVREMIDDSGRWFHEGDAWRPAKSQTKHPRSFHRQRP